METQRLSRDAQNMQDYQLLNGRWKQVVRRVYQTTRLDGSCDEIVLGPFETEEEATAAWVDRQAMLYGWTPPRWWEFWRRNDQPRAHQLAPPAP